MSGREQEPWQRRVRQSREQREWQDAPVMEVPQGPPVPEPARQPPPGEPKQPVHVGTGDAGDSVWRASASFGKLIGFVLAFTFPALALFSFWRFRATDGASSLLALAAVATLGVSAAGIIYILRGLGTIRYVIGRDRLTIVWMGEQRVVRFDEIREIVYEPRIPIARRGYETFWPGYHVSTMQMRDGAWQSVATQSPGRRIRIVTRTGIHAISPRRPVLFLGELARRRQAYATGVPDVAMPQILTQPERLSVPPQTGPRDKMATWTQLQRQPLGDEHGAPGEGSSEHSTAVARMQARRTAGRAPLGWVRAYVDLFRTRLLGDQIASGLVAVGVMIPMLMAAFLYSQYQGIPNVVPLHWDAHGDVDAVGSPRDLWRLPLIAVLILILNTTLATALIAVDRFMARFLVAITPAVQALVFVALIRAVT